MPDEMQRRELRNDGPPDVLNTRPTGGSEVERRFIWRTTYGADGHYAQGEGDDDEECCVPGFPSLLGEPGTPHGRTSRVDDRR